MANEMSEPETSINREITFTPIGVIHSPFKKPKGTPIQPGAARDVEGTAVIFDPYREGLKDIDGFSHLILIYYFHLATGSSLIAKPFLDEESHGIFAVRAPGRPNPIGLSVVRLCAVEDGRLHLQDVDIVDGTPLLDIKPYVPEFDVKTVQKIGWLEGRVSRMAHSRDDGRFSQE
jgi:tRNA-Thr(GGU) m(6)t(6)A37 methyltransferase TsaA